jgi:hypothetical protein
VLVSAVACAAALLILRRPAALLNPQLQGGEATVLLRDALDYGVRSLFAPWDGYSQLLPRAVALLGSGLSLRWTPLWYYLAALGGLLIVIAWLLATSRLPFDSPTRWLLAASVVTFPLSVGPMVSLADLQWFLLAGALLLAVARPPASLRHRLLEAGLVAGLGLTGQFAIVLAPVYLRRWLRRRRGDDFGLFALSLGLGALQLRFAAAFNAARPADSLSAWLRALAGHLRAAVTALAAAITPAQVSPLLVAAVLALLAGLIAADALRRGVRGARPLLLAGGLAFGCALLSVDPAARRGWDVDARYLFLPLLSFEWLVILWQAQRPAAARLVLGSLLLFSVVHFRQPPLADLNWPAGAACLSANPDCVVPLNPPGQFLKLRRFTPPPDLQPAGDVFGETITLLGYDLRQTPEQLEVTLAWQARAPMARSYTRFAHVSASQQPARLAAQADSLPLAGQGPEGFVYPTSGWARGEVVIERLAFPLTGLAPGLYELAVGWYDAGRPALDRLPAANAAGRPWPGDRAVVAAAIAIP